MVVAIDGAVGEGGGQILRTSLALAAATGREVRVTNVRANRPRPGLRPQHVTAAEALARLTDGRVAGAEEDSREVTFRPGPVIGGEFEFHVGTAGSVTLVLQALLPALAASRQRFTLHVDGGTDVPFAPTWDHTAHVHFRVLERLGLVVEPTLHRRGYFPAGGGRVSVVVDAGGFHAADLVERGRVRSLHACVHAHGLPKAVIQRGAESLDHHLVEAGVTGLDLVTELHRGPGQGFGLAAWAVTDGGAVGADAVGQKRVRAEVVGAQAARALALELKSGAAVDVHEADALPVFMALAGGGSFTTRTLTPHARTTLDLLPRFLPVRATTEPTPAGLTRVTISQA